MKTLAGVIIFLSLLMSAPAAAQAPSISDLVGQLSDRKTEWGAAARLQKLGAPAAAALVANLRRDGRLDRHGNHSPTMHALEKMGAVAVAELERTLTPALLASANPDDVAHVQAAAHALRRIDASTTATLVRVGLSARDSRVREVAFGALGVEWERTGRESRGHPWVLCLRYKWRHSCPFDSRIARIDAEVRPLLASIRERLPHEPRPSVRRAAAYVLALYGEGASKSAGERELMALARQSEEPYTQERAVRALGLLRVDAARDLLRNSVNLASSSLKRAAAEALQRLRDPGYLSVAADLMKLPTADLEDRDWAIGFAGQSRDLAFVPILIELLGSTDRNGHMTRRFVVDRMIDVPQTFGISAHAALRELTFQDFGQDPRPWRDWWAANRSVDWRTLLDRHIDTFMERIPAAEPWVMNEWMDALVDIDDPAVVRFLTAYFHHPRFDIQSVGPDTSSASSQLPPVLTLLLSLVRQDSSEARKLLYECGDRRDDLAVECLSIEAVFDRDRAVNRLNELLAESPDWNAAHTLLELGDARGIPALLELLDDSFDANRSLAFSSLRRYTQEDIAYDADAPVDQRRAAAERWRAWWRSAQRTFVVKTNAAWIEIECCRL